MKSPIFARAIYRLCLTILQLVLLFTGLVLREHRMTEFRANQLNKAFSINILAFRFNRNRYFYEFLF